MLAETSADAAAPIRRLSIGGVDPPASAAPMVSPSCFIRNAPARLHRPAARRAHSSASAQARETPRPTASANFPRNAPLALRAAFGLLEAHAKINRQKCNSPNCDD